MPFQSKSQQRKFFADPELRQYAKEWADKTDFSKLPEKVKKKKRTHEKVAGLNKFTCHYLECLAEAGK